ncbi:isovaleryl-CoA dehydrogenase [Variovorax sp. J22R133]|uniref:isovaleryl-CoA dehydrogenase n=1 Tax=Variovorax brevis TaxID=3053503 RepID=UPI00257675DA|nr:isovaleryl-CoA dehydrogenase [Variovorax sp. J22R133]MDM0110609.1 isovaleryl-CoA dehydrogenase [Variovorax sp. J22R133]
MTWQTHEITNQFDELKDYNLYDTDAVLREAMARAGAGWAEPQLSAFGQTLGKAETWQAGADANHYKPEFSAFDARGRRIDSVTFHPSWHQLMAGYRSEGLVSLPFRDVQQQGRWAAWAAGFYLQGQVEAGVLCPATMTQAAIPVLQKEPALWEKYGAKLMSNEYDPRDIPMDQKKSVWIGMGMTEKQGGSDVRANTTTATPISAGGRGGEYLIRGHKWFFSVPMSDAHLVVARTQEGGHSCFFVPRWKPDGTKNPVQIQRLKEKVGNRSNSSSEVEFQDAWGVMMGEEGRGIPTIIEMATYTRLNCVVGSSGFLRQATAQAIGYARKRKVFGKLLVEQPLMRGVLADLALESEAGLVLSMRLAEAFEHGDDPAQRVWKRVMTPAAKFWICKRAVEISGEAMEVFGGNGYVESGPMARMFREAPVNSIWEGSGNVMCLDVMRAIAREPDAAHALLEELAADAGGDSRILGELQALRDMLMQPPEQLEALGRRFTQRLVIAAQATLLRKVSPGFVADAFVSTRLDPQWGRVVGAIDTRAIDVDALLQRALPA